MYNGKICLLKYCKEIRSLNKNELNTVDPIAYENIRILYNENFRQHNRLICVISTGITSFRLLKKFNQCCLFVRNYIIVIITTGYVL